MAMLIKKTILFGLVFSLIFSQISIVFFPNWKTETSRMKTFYKQPKNSIDVLFLGTSTTLHAFSPLLLWDEYGFTSYNRATDVQLPIVTYYYLMESLKYQQPKVVVIDPRWLFFNYEVDDHEAWLRFAVDMMDISLTKVKLINEVMKSSKNQSFVSYLFPLLRYHSRWNELTRLDFEEKSHIKYDFLRGYSPFKNTCLCEWPANFMEPSQTIAELNPQAEYYFKKIIDLCAEEKIEIVFVTVPKLMNWDYSKYLAMQNYSKENNIKYLDFNTTELIEVINLDPLNDFQDRYHLNNNGAIKISKHIGEYLSNMYNLPNKENKPEYKNWNADLFHFYSIEMADE
ncbi:MAG: hypothetical protein RBT49_15295 [Bacteroidales bacterium]|jgi:hypothetical protein|nr:hypothetical protein [Bacteroidales bacterium]